MTKKGIVYIVIIILISQESSAIMPLPSSAPCSVELLSMFTAKIIIKF